MSRFFLRWVNTVLRPLDVVLAPSASVAPRTPPHNSLEGLVSELSRFEGGDVLATVPLTAGRGLPQFSWGENGTHPFVTAAKAGVAHRSFDEARSAVAASLAGFYSTYQPGSLHDMFWEPAERPGNFGEYPAWAVMMPWQGGGDIDSWMRKISETVRKEGRAIKGGLTIREGWSWSGPVSPGKLNLEATRLTRTLRAIKKSGYRRHDGFDGDIRAIVLVNANGDWVWQSYAGQHRAAVLSALGVQQVPVRVSGLVREHDFLTWPQVTNGLYTADQGLDIFHRVFGDGQPA